MSSSKNRKKKVKGETCGKPCRFCLCYRWSSLFRPWHSPTTKGILIAQTSRLRKRLKNTGTNMGILQTWCNYDCWLGSPLPSSSFFGIMYWGVESSPAPYIVSPEKRHQNER